MARPLRLEFPGAVYHVTARGDRQEPIFEDDGQRIRISAAAGPGSQAELQTPAQVLGLVSLVALFTERLASVHSLVALTLP